MRRRRFKKSNYSNTGVNLLGIVAIVLAAIVAGFLLTEFIVYPVMLGTSSPISHQEGKNNEAADTGTDPTTQIAPQKTAAGNGEQTQQSTSGQTQTTPDKLKTQQSGYCIQFGSFATKEAADTLLAQLAAGGIKASVVEKDGTFKVVGEIFSDKAAASAAMAGVDRAIYSDIFVTNI